VSALKKLKRSTREAIEGYLFILPWLIGLVVFTVGPIVATLFISCTEWQLFGAPKWVGLANYVRMFNDPLFYQSLKVTLYYTLLSLPLGLAVGLALALLLFQNVKGQSIFRTIFYVPSVVPAVASATIWIWIYNPEFGIFNYILSKFGITGPEWLYSTEWIIPAIAIMGIWGAGSTMVIYLAGLQNIPRMYWEAATVDGASKWQQFWKITLPLLSPTTFFLFVTGLIGSLQTFTAGYIMGGGGGPLNASLFYCLYMYQQGWKWFNMGYASALSWVLSVIIFVLTLFVVKASRSRVQYDLM
jgi:multiple sugar transport system permease protein